MNSKIVIVAVLIVLLIGLAGWYFYMTSLPKSPEQVGQNSTTPQNTTTPGTTVSSDSTSSISSDFNQVPQDPSLNNDMSSVNKDVLSF